MRVLTLHGVSLPLEEHPLLEASQGLLKGGQLVRGDLAGGEDCGRRLGLVVVFTW